ncbi:MAG: hypothetical protein R3B99_02935 [Polyangiales bacterium]
MDERNRCHRDLKALEDAPSVSIEVARLRTTLAASAMRVEVVTTGAAVGVGPSSRGRRRGGRRRGTVEVDGVVGVESCSTRTRADSLVALNCSPTASTSSR